MVNRDRHRVFLAKNKRTAFSFFSHTYSAVACALAKPFRHRRVGKKKLRCVRCY
jgi:hypothetical protein